MRHVTSKIYGRCPSWKRILPIKIIIPYLGTKKEVQKSSIAEPVVRSWSTTLQRCSYCCAKSPLAQSPCERYAWSTDYTNRQMAHTASLSVQGWPALLDNVATSCRSLTSVGSK